LDLREFGEDEAANKLLELSDADYKKIGGSILLRVSARKSCESQ
jgi:hypothetical protein